MLNEFNAADSSLIVVDSPLMGSTLLADDNNVIAECHSLADDSNDVSERF